MFAGDRPTPSLVVLFSLALRGLCSALELNKAPLVLGSWGYCSGKPFGCELVAGPLMHACAQAPDST